MRSINNFIRVIFSLSIAFCALNVFCLTYYRLPVHITSQIKATDYVWEQHAYYSKMTEGFGYGRMNGEGFNNLQDYNAQTIDILLMGSSQMEGTNVPQEKTTASLLNKLFNKTKYIYNIGISGHDFPHIVNNLETAIQHYSPDEYVVIETGAVLFDIKSLENAINSNLKRIPSYNSKIIFFLQKMPYLRLFYNQYKNITGNGDKEDVPEEVSTIDKEEYSQVLDKAMKKIHKISVNNNIKPMIFYHPHLNPDNSDYPIVNTDNEYLAVFKKTCVNNDIYFVDMTDAFIEEYKNNHILPHGFLNTAVGVGHLNKNGHRLIANELFRCINETETIGSL